MLEGISVMEKKAGLREIKRAGVGVGLRWAERGDNDGRGDLQVCDLCEDYSWFKM